jgi:hypothetical protein
LARVSLTSGGIFTNKITREVGGSAIYLALSYLPLWICEKLATIFTVLRSSRWRAGCGLCQAVDRNLMGEADDPKISDRFSKAEMLGS